MPKRHEKFTTITLFYESVAQRALHTPVGPYELDTPGAPITQDPTRLGLDHVMV